MSKLLVIVGSTRPTRSADLVLPWLTRKVSGHEAFDAEIVDLRDWPLPIFGEHFGTIGDFSDPTYSEPIVKAWNDKIKGADAYVIVTPEYNHSVRDAFDADGQPKNPIVNAAADIMLDDLAWWSAALAKARADGELKPGTFRLQAALAAAS